MTTLMTILSQLSPNYLILAKQKSLEETVHRQYLPGFYPSVSQKNCGFLSDQTSIGYGTLENFTIFY